MEAYKNQLINEIESLKPILVQMGFDYPLNSVLNLESTETLEDFYAEIHGFIDLHNFRAKNYPHTSGR